MRSDNKYNPSQPTIELAPPATPQAALQVVLLPGGHVAVHFQGPLSGFVLEGMLGEARRVLHQKLAEAEAGPRVQAAPPGLVIQ